MDDVTGQRKCEPCSPGFLQPLQGQTTCLPCPASGVDCTVQNAVEVDTGWFRALDGANSSSTSSGLFDAAAGGTIGLTVYNISLTVAASLDDFSTSAFEERLRSFLPCPASTCGMALSVEAGSVLVRADVADTMGASAASAVMLTTMSTTELETALNVTVEGDVRVRGSRAISLLSSDAMAPVRCPQRSGCLGSASSACAAGHTGLLCGTCEDGYFRGESGCERCGQQAVPSVALYAMGGVLALGLGFLYMFAQLRRGEQQRAAATSAAPAAAAARGTARKGNRAVQPPKRRRGPMAALAAQLARRAESIGTIGKILLAYFQVLHAFSQLRSIAWPPVFAAYLRALSPFSFQFFSTYPLSCVVDVQISFHDQLLAVLLLPVGGAVLVLLVAVLAAQCTLPRGERGLCAVAARPETCSLQLWLLLLLYPMLAKTALIPFDCVDIGGQELLRANPAVACDDAAWHISKWLGVLGTAAYAFGFPLLCWYVTYTANRARRAAVEEAAAAASAAVEEASSSVSVPSSRAAIGGGVRKVSSTAKSKANSAESSKAAVATKTRGGPSALAETSLEVGGSGKGRFARARLLLRSYRAEFWYWESLDVFRKYILTSVVLVVPFQDSLLQVYLGLLVCMIALTLVARHQPYADPLCGKLQLLCLTQLTFTYMSGMLFFDVGDGGIAAFGAQAGGSGSGNADEAMHNRWGAILVGVNVLSFLLLGAGLCSAVGGSLAAAREEIVARRAAEAALRTELIEVRALLAEPNPALKKAKISIDELHLDGGSDGGGGGGARLLGAGQFGEVYSSSYRGTPVAVKRLHSHHADARKRVEAFRDEVLLLLSLRHPNIVQLVGGSWDVDAATVGSSSGGSSGRGGELCLVLELCAGGSLEDLLEDPLNHLLWAGQLLPIAIGVARGMAYLHGHSPPIVHRDLKPANVLLMPDLTPKVADMGAALELDDGMQDFVAGSGTPLYQAPEVLRREEADHRCDVWSFGCVMCCLSTRSHPYAPFEPAAAVDLVSQLKLQPAPPRQSPIAGVVESATALEYEDRPSFEELLKTLTSDEMASAAREADQAAAAAPRVPRASKRRLSLIKEAASVSSDVDEDGGGVLPSKQMLPPPAKKGARFSAACSWLQAASQRHHARPTDKRATESDADLVAAMGAAAAETEAARKTSVESKLSETELADQAAAAAAREASEAAAHGGPSAEEAARKRKEEQKRARRFSLKAADSERSLHGHKSESPGYRSERSQRKKAARQGGESVRV